MGEALSELLLISPVRKTLPVYSRMHDILDVDLHRIEITGCN